VSTNELIFIGLHKIGQGPAFTHWVNNASLSYTAWRQPEEPGLAEGEDCVFLQGGLWMDYGCAKVVKFLCEKNVAYEQLT
jgi:Lectin C-type domain